MRLYSNFTGEVKRITLELSEGPQVINLGDRQITLDDRVYEMSLTKDLVIVTIADPGFQHTATLTREQCSTEKVQAYDWQGNHLWSIADLIPDMPLPIYSGFLIDRDTIVPFLTDPQKGAGHDLYACFIGAWKYVIDLQERRVLLKLHMRW